MADESKDTYGMESSSSPAPSHGGDGEAPLADSSASAPRAGRPIEPSPSSREPLPLEPHPDDEVPMSMRSVKALDVCPNCGANMANTDDVVCLRCGFDLKTMKQVKTATGAVEVGAGAAAQDGAGEAGGPQRRPLVIDGLGGTTAPLIAAGVAGALLVLGYLAGINGLFGPVLNAKGEVMPGAEIPFNMRVAGLFKAVISIGMWTGCGLVSLTFFAYLNGLRLGDLRLAASRMLGIVALMHLVRFMNFSSNGVEWTVEAIAQAGIFAALSMVMFSLKPKDVPMLVGGTIILFLVMWLGALAVVWGAG